MGARVISLFLRCQPPKTTAQQKRMSMRSGRPVFFHSSKQESEAHTWAVLLSPHRPSVPMVGPVALSLRAVYPHTAGTRKRDRASLLPKATRPDCDNLSKHLIDVLAHMRFIEGDQQVARLVVEKWHGPADQVGIGIEIRPVEAWSPWPTR